MTVDVWVCCGGRAVVVCRSHPRRFRLLFRFRSYTSFLPLLLHLFPQIYRLERVYTSFDRLCTPIFRGVYIFIYISEYAMRLALMGAMPLLLTLKRGGGRDNMYLRYN